MEEGLTQGRQEGLQQGLQQFRSLLIQQLKTRFPRKITPDYLYRIEHAQSDQLFYWIERLATASSIEEVFSCF